MIDDILWIRLIQSGNQVVFEHLYRSYFTPLCRFISLYIENKTEAEEITAELFIYVWEHRENIDFSLSLKSSARSVSPRRYRSARASVPTSTACFTFSLFMKSASAWDGSNLSFF